MDPVTITGIAYGLWTVFALAGYYIFKEKPERAAREEAAAEYERRRTQDELEQKRRELERREREKPFATAEECFRKEYISYARISTYCSCPHRFKLIYLDKVPTYDDGFGYRRKGVVLHGALENCLKPYTGMTISHLDKQEIVRAAYTLGYLLHSKTWRSEAYKEMVNKRRRALRENVKFICATFPSPVEVVAVEHQLRFQLDGLNFYGIVDLVLRYPDGHFEIVDYKTGMRRPIKEQLEIYSIPFGKPSNQLSISFRIICVDRESHYLWTQDINDTSETTRRILTIAKTIMADKSYPPVVKARCRDCSVMSACRYSEGYKLAKSEKGDRRAGLLTRLDSQYEWKHGNEPPRVRKRRSTSDYSATRPSRIGQGLSFSLIRATQQYCCLKSGRPIETNEYHFADHRGQKVLFGGVP